MKRSRVWLCASPLAFFVLDLGLTLHGQPPAYWAGDYARAVEMNPLALWLMHYGPAAVITVTVFWLIALVAMIVCLPEALARVTAFAFLFLHTLGAASWLIDLVPRGFGYLSCILLFILSAQFMKFTWKRATEAQAPPLA